MSDLFEINEMIIERMALDIEQVGSSDEIIIEQNRLDVLSVSEQGPPGPKGDDGEPAYILCEASGAIGGHRVVCIFDGIATYADNTSNYVGQIGLTMSATDDGDNLNAYISGIMTEPTWNFSQGPVFLSTNGLLTQSLPTSGSVIIIGNAVSSTAINLQPQVICKRN